MPLPQYKISSKSTNQFKRCTLLRSLNIRHFEMVEAMRLKKWCRGHLQWRHLPTKFHKKPPIGSKVISVAHTDRLVIL